MQLLILLWRLRNLPFVSENAPGFHCCCVISRSWLCINWQFHQHPGDTFRDPWSKVDIARQGGQTDTCGYRGRLRLTGGGEWQELQRDPIQLCNGRGWRLNCTSRERVPGAAWVGCSLDHLEKKQEKEGGKEKKRRNQIVLGNHV